MRWIKNLKLHEWTDSFELLSEEPINNQKGKILFSVNIKFLCIISILNIFFLKNKIIK